MISVPWCFRQRSTTKTCLFKRGVLALGMLSSSQHVYSNEISDSRYAWQLIIASCTRAIHFDVQQWSSSSHYIEVLSLPMQVFQILALRGRAGKKLTEERAASEKAFPAFRKTAFQHPCGNKIAPLILSVRKKNSTSTRKKNSTLVLCKFIACSSARKQK